MSQPVSRENWHLSKSVPISLIFALLIQAGAVVWHGSQWTAAIAQNTRDIDQLRSENVVIARSVQDQAIQLARIEENTRNSAEQIAHLVRTLDQQARIRQ